jgi:lipoprotein-anchoring transpeptidase ErfK/SrfK
MSADLRDGLQSEDLDVTSVYPSGSGPYGVGIVVRLEFAEPVPMAARAVIERGIHVQASRPLKDAAWSWINDEVLIFRPRTFWPRDTKVTVTSHWDPAVLAALGTQSQGGDPAVLVTDDQVRAKFTIGRSQVLTISDDTQMGKLAINGDFVREVPVSLGKPGWETRSGIKAIMERYRVNRMTSQEVGDRTQSYDLMVPYAMRLTPTGEFLHAAPWATGRLGVYAGSHGCTNLSMSDGEWFFTNALEGDPVITQGTGRSMESWNGPGGSWNVPWRQWLDGSAAGAVETVSR